ncbi:MAG: amidohydrolase family protein [Dehalococcoidia bacterium]
MTTTALRGARVWDGLGTALVEATVVLDGPKVDAVGSDAGADLTVDLSGLTLLPGLIEGHAHLCFNAGADWRSVYDHDSPERMLLRMQANGLKMLESGITTVRDLGAPTGLSIELREALTDGLVTGPSLLVAGAPITTTGGHCHFMGGEADGPLEVRKAVREHVKAGVDWIKVMATGGNMTRGTNTYAAQYSVEELAACVEEAHRLRRRVAAHCHGTEGIRVAVAAGVDSIEHCTFSSPEGIDFDEGLMAEIAEKRIAVSPTVSIGYRLWPDDGLRQRRAAVLSAIAASGAPLIMSTDCGIPRVPHEALAGGMQVLAELAGLAPVDVLRLATSEAAHNLGLRDRGTVAPGQRADLIAVEGDPATDLRALERVRFVMAAGKVIRRP